MKQTTIWKKYHLQRRAYFKDNKYIIIITKHKKYSSNLATYQLPMFVSQIQKGYMIIMRCIVFLKILRNSLYGAF